MDRHRAIARAALHHDARARQRRDRRQRRRAARGHDVPVRPDAGRASVPQGHKVALVDLAAGDAGAALQRRHRPRGQGHPGRQLGARAAARDARGALARRPADRDRQARAACRRSRATPSRATATPTARSARATSWRSRTTVQCVAGVVDFAVKRIKDELLPKYPERRRRGRPGAHLRLRRGDRRARRGDPDPHLRNITLNPNFGGEVMVVSLGCEKLQPERLLPPGIVRDRRRAQRRRCRRERRGQARRGVPAGRRARRLHVDDRFDHGARPRSTSNG